MIVLALALALAAGPQSHPQTRCGWLENPTPANWWLADREGEWLLGAQGGYQTPGMDAMPDMSTRGWIATNGSYGRGCACLTVTTDPRTHRITRLLAARPLPLRQCRADRRLRHR